MKVKVCTCTQCRLTKRSKRSSVKRYFKRLANKKRRKMKPGEVYNFYWA